MLDEALDALADGASAGVGLVGEPGIGKTMLLREACRGAERRGFAVLRGGAAELEREVPFGLALDALGETLASMLPSLSAGPAGSDAELPGDRYRSYHAIRAALQELAVERPLVLALDDVQWGDAASVELLAHLFCHRTEGGALLVFAYRPHQATPGLRQAVSTAARNQGVQLLELGPLGEEEARTLLGDGFDDATLSALHRDSGGNPFYLGELARAAGAADDRVPAAIRAAVAAEVEQASPEARELVRAASVAGDPFTLELAARIAGMEEEQVLTAINELVELDLARPTRVPRRYDFRHPVVGRAVYAGAGEGFLLAAHGRAARALEGSGSPPTALASHLARAATPGDERAAELLAAAAEEIASRAPRTAADWLVRALHLLPEGVSVDRRVDILLPLAATLAASDQIGESRAALVDALSLLPPEETSPRARVVGEIARLDHALGAHGEAGRLLSDALAAGRHEPSAARVALKVELAVDHWLGSDWPRMAAAAAEAAEDAQALGERLLDGAAAAVLAVARCCTGETAAGGVAADRAAALLDEAPDEAVAARIEALAALGHAELALERYADAARHLERGIAVRRATGQRSWLVAMLCLLCAAELARGRLREATAAAEAAVQAARPSHERPLLWALSLRSRVQRTQGDLAAAFGAAEEAVAIAERVPATSFNRLAYASLGLAQVECGEPAEGRDRILARAGGPELDLVEPSWRPRLYDVLTEAELELGELEAAEAWAARAKRAAAPHGLDGRGAEARRSGAAVRLARGDARGAAELAHEAAEGFGRAGRRIEAARASILEARALTALGDSEAAVERLAGAHGELDACGAARYRDEAARDLRRLGRHVARRRAPSGSARGYGSLSEREREVVQLVARGMTNREIAGELFLSPKTVERHLARVFEKLRVSSRLAAARALERARLDGDDPAR
jgi:DNA-binding CsgD family transcriptional regulator/tetratricopeptide (TPR) repeat protein